MKLTVVPRQVICRYPSFTIHLTLPYM